MDRKLVGLATATALVLTLLPGQALAQWDNDWWFDWFDPIPPIIDPGWDLIGRDLNGEALDGELLDGRRINHLTLNDAKLDKKGFKAVSLVQSQFYGITSKSQTVSGQGFVGTEFKAHLDSGKHIYLRIDAMALHSDAHNQDIHVYDVSYETKDGWMPLCGAGVNAVPLKGRWDHSQGTATGGSWINDSGSFTFACENAAVGKCATHGYAPWRLIGTPQISMRNHHQACTRMMRADYCGDGTSHTVNGKDVNLYDDLGVRHDSETWTFEGEWSANGAVCISATRVTGTQPSCMAQLQDASCGNPANFDDSTLLFSEFKPN